MSIGKKATRWVMREEAEMPQDESGTVKHEWRARIECGEIYKTLPPFPLNPRSKPETQQVLYAIEELYFYRRFQEAVELTGKALEQEDLMEDFRGW
ncbi:hypothetical protein DID88_001883 [Monilinia fructigena]|uniref:Uncharacterized protein n=1 Tax=Monilinia fructigena TaxID=38457 RepID=A0A395IVT2_9HELO|nr:hypothetical protein DID88_001883 [Monilinia fructigena]